jgi:hypothetical protein
MVVHPSVPARNVPEFIAYAKANPGKVTMASAGNGAPSHVSGELFKMMTGVNMVHVPYRGGGPALTDLVGGQVQLYFAPMLATIKYIRAGTLRALAVTTRERPGSNEDELSRELWSIARLVLRNWLTNSPAVNWPCWRAVPGRYALRRNSGAFYRIVHIDKNACYLGDFLLVIPEALQSNLPTSIEILLGLLAVVISGGLERAAQQILHNARLGKLSHIGSYA